MDCTAESLTLAQISDVVNTTVVTEKWNHVDNGIGTTGTKVNTETWMEPFDGDECQASSDANSSGACLSPQPGYPVGMVKMANWHQGGMNNAFFDGHAKWLQPTTIWQSIDLTGCALIHAYPSTQPNSEVCDQTIPGCTAPSPATSATTSITEIRSRKRVQAPCPLTTLHPSEHDIHARRRHYEAIAPFL